MTFTFTLHALHYMSFTNLGLTQKTPMYSFSVDINTGRQLYFCIKNKYLDETTCVGINSKFIS